MGKIYIDPMVYLGRPKEKRSCREEKVYDCLEACGISFERVDHDPAATVELCKGIEKKLMVPICKNLFLSNRQKTEFYLLMMPGYKHFRTSEVSRNLEVSRLSFAPGDEMVRYLDTKPGSASILGLINDREHRVQLVIDREVFTEEYIGCHPCVNTSSLKIKSEDLVERFFPYLHLTPIWLDL